MNLFIDKLIDLCKEHNVKINQDKNSGIIYISNPEICKSCESKIHINVICNCPDSEH